MLKFHSHLEKLVVKEMIDHKQTYHIVHNNYNNQNLLNLEEKKKHKLNN